MFSIISNRVNVKADRHKNTRKEYSKAEQIPMEILQEILSYLHPRDLLRWGHQAMTRRSIPLVCKVWHDAGMQCLYRSLDLTDDSSLRANLVLRTLEARGDLADYVIALHFPWSFMAPKSRKNNMEIFEQLICYARIVSLCHSLVTFFVPAILHSVLFSSTLPGVYLQPSITNKLVELKIFGVSFRPRSFILQGSFSSLRYLELVDLDLTVLESPYIPPFPCLPSLETLHLVDVSAKTTHAKQIMTSLLKGILKNLSIRYSGLFCSFMHDTLPIIGPSLETFGTNESGWVEYCHTSRPDWKPPNREEIDRMLPSISVFSVATNRSGKLILHCLPSSISVFYIDRPCGCADGGESSNGSGYDPTVELLDSLTSSQSQFFKNHLYLNAIVLAGKTCSWRNTEARDHLELFCQQNGVKVIPMVEGPCTVALPNSRNSLHTVLGQTSRAMGFFRDKIASLFH